MNLLQKSANIGNESQDWNSRTGWQTNSEFMDVADHPINSTWYKVLSSGVNMLFPGLKMRNDYVKPGLPAMPLSVSAMGNAMLAGMYNPNDRAKVPQQQALRIAHAQSWGYPGDNHYGNWIGGNGGFDGYGFS